MINLVSDGILNDLFVGIVTALLLSTLVSFLRKRLMGPSSFSVPTLVEAKKCLLWLLNAFTELKEAKFVNAGRVVGILLS